jgi:prepilin-type processing-associated H-X9-DG protein
VYSTDFTAWRTWVRPPSSATDYIVDFRHPGPTANVLWLDGHGTAEKPSPLMDSTQLWDRN